MARITFSISVAMKKGPLVVMSWNKTITEMHRRINLVDFFVPTKHFNDKSYQQSYNLSIYFNSNKTLLVKSLNTVPWKLVRLEAISKSCKTLLHLFSFLQSINKNNFASFPLLIVDFKHSVYAQYYCTTQIKYINNN